MSCMSLIVNGYSFIPTGRSLVLCVFAAAVSCTHCYPIAPVQRHGQVVVASFLDVTHGVKYSPDEVAKHDKGKWVTP
jgi:hypothetical protein